MANIELHKSSRRKRPREEVDFIVLVISFLVALVGAYQHLKYRIKEPRKNEDERRREFLNRLYNDSDTICYHQLRVYRRPFAQLCSLLREKGGLVATRHVTIEEIVALFLYILAHNLKNSTIKTWFRRSGETISRQFHIVLKAVLKLGKELIKVQETTLNEKEFQKWRWFENALGALDGTHVLLTVPLEGAPRYRNRKGLISTNVLAACDGNLKFTYVLPGWEGSASDSRVLRDALHRRSPLNVPSGKYYLVDAGYTNGEGFLAPYRKTRYHLNEWRGIMPTNHRELFNLRHSTARNAIERAFGCLKKRWAILRMASFYSVRTQVRVINACCVIHNFIRDVMPNESLLEEVDKELENQPIPNDGDEDGERITTVRMSEEWTTFRENLAMTMFDEYRRRRGHLA